MVKVFLHLGCLVAFLVAVSIARPVHPRVYPPQRYELILPAGDRSLHGGTAAPPAEQALADDGAVRSERSTNLSHITGTARKIQMYIKNRYLQILPDGAVNGTSDDGSDYNCRFGSHNTLHQYGVNTPTRNNSLLSLQQIRTPQQQQLYAEFSTMSTKTTSCNLASGSKIQSPLSTIITNMNSIHQAIADLALGEDTADDQQRRRRMWTLTEVSSTYEEDRPVNSVHLALEHSGDSCVQRRSGTHRESGQVNSAYIEEPIVMDYTEEDDDVFVSGAVATLSSNIAGFNERLFIRNTMMENENDTIQNSGNVLVPRQSKEQFELGVQHTGSVSSRNSAGAGFPESSSKLYRPNSLIIDEADITNYSLDDHDMTKLSPCRCRMKEVIVASNDGINCNGANVLTLGSENNVSSTGISENNRTHISSENLRLSPLKIVGEFLFHTNSKKPTRLKDVLNESCEFKKNGGECEDSLDCHSAVQRLKGSETPQDNGCAVHKHEVTKCVDDTVT